MDSPVLVRPAGNGPEGETGTTVRYQKTGGFLKPEGALIPPPKDAVQHRMGVEVHLLIFLWVSSLSPDNVMKYINVVKLYYILIIFSSLLIFISTTISYRHQVPGSPYYTRFF